MTIEGVVEVGAADVLLAEPGWATLRRKQLAADRLIGPVVALFLSVARHLLLQAQAALASEPLPAGVTLWIVAKMVGRRLPRGTTALARRDGAACGEVLDALVRAGALHVSLPVDGLATGLREQVAADFLVRVVRVVFTLLLFVANPSHGYAPSFPTPESVLTINGTPVVG